MPDRVLILTGPTAPLFCRGLLETGGFIRLRNMPVLSFPMLYGANTVSKHPPARQRPSSGKILTNEWRIRGKIIENTRTPVRIFSQGPKEEDDEPDQPFKAPDEWNTQAGFSVCGSVPRISIVLSVMQAFPNLFMITAKEEKNRTVIHCRGTPVEIHTVLEQICSSFAELQSA